MPEMPRFIEAADNTRPFQSHRYDVFAPKLNRNLTLFGLTSVDVWITLEADPEVILYCERPLLLPDTKPKRVIDFWVKRQTSEEFLFVLRPSELSAGLRSPDSIPAFRRWAKANQLSIKYLDPADISNQKVLLANWGRILRDLGAFGRHLPAELADRVITSLKRGVSLQVLEQRLPEVDPILVRVAAFALLHRGRAICKSLNREILGPTTEIELT
ncbi:hypothetical protein [Undibacterium sp. TJN19]|uniref:hypothetical protein n=1 Tax=Undibacterium sp. TJN19 TaxID=3413055 RepID=UPI003BF02492